MVIFLSHSNLYTKTFSGLSEMLKERRGSYLNSLLTPQSFTWLTWDLLSQVISSFPNCILTPKGERPFFSLFLDIGQAIVDVIFVQKTSNFWWICGLVLASSCTNFYKIPIFGYTVMRQKQFIFVKQETSGSQKTF
jgi:hypothetical protein